MLNEWSRRRRRRCLADSVGVQGIWRTSDIHWGTSEDSGIAHLEHLDECSASLKEQLSRWWKQDNREIQLKWKGE